MLSEKISTEKQIINLINPVKGRIEQFQFFMVCFKWICNQLDKCVFLTVVYFGTEALNAVNTIYGKDHREEYEDGYS